MREKFLKFITLAYIALIFCVCLVVGNTSTVLALQNAENTPLSHETAYNSEFSENETAQNSVEAFTGARKKTSAVRISQAGEEDDQPTFNGLAISSTVISDSYLYEGLLKAFREDYRIKTGHTFTGTTIYSDMFKDFETLNLDGLGISYLTGIDKIDFDNLKNLSLNRNELSEFDATLFVGTSGENTTLESLSLAGNGLTKVDITPFVRLVSLNVSSNKLTSIDLSNIEGKVAETEFSLNIAGNLFTSLDSVKLPSNRIGKINLNIIGNDIVSIPDSFFDSRISMQIGVQGFENSTVSSPVSVDTASNFVVYKTGIENLSVEVFKIDEDLDKKVETIDTFNMQGNFVKLNLPVGRYRFDYTIDGVSANDKNDVDKMYLISRRFNVIPQKAQYTYTFKGKTYESLGKVTGKVTVNLATPEEGAKIFYSVNGADWVEGNTVECDRGGSYSIKVKTVIGSYESETITVWVRTSLNLLIPDALMLVIVLLLTLVLFIIVVPLISRKFFRKG